MREAQKRNKANYDKQSTVRCLKPHQKALIIMPTHGSKLFARWGGPYTVLKKCRNNNYILDVNGREALLHMNTLRKYEADTDWNPNVDSAGTTDNPRLSPFQ